MYFADLLTFVDKELCIQKFLERCEDVPDIDRLTTALSQAIDNLKSLRPNFSDKSTIHIGRAEENNGSYDYAFLIVDGDDEYTYSFEAVPWSDVLGYRVDDKEIENYEREYFVSLVLWEMTWFGYDEETIQNRWKELSYYIDEHEFMEKFMKIAQCNLGDKKEGYLEK